jgi:hypothetical protein
MADFPVEALHGRWVHSHEEDTAGEMVFRPPDHGFPPSRGRLELALEPDGKFVELGPGATDRPEEAGGSWSLEDDTLVLSREGEGGARVMRIAAAEGDRLVVQK